MIGHQYESQLTVPVALGTRRRKTHSWDDRCCYTAQSAEPPNLRTCPAFGHVWHIDLSCLQPQTNLLQQTLVCFTYLCSLRNMFLHRRLSRHVTQRNAHSSLASEYSAQLLEQCHVEGALR